MVSLERLEKVAIIRLNRPEVHHAINQEMMGRLTTILDEVEASPQILTIILTAAGTESFCAGGDLRYFATLTTREACLKMSQRMQGILNRLYEGERVVIAAVNGQALGGGCEIITACHLRIAAEHATFTFRQAPNGIITGWGGGKRLLEQLPKMTALRFLLTGEKFDAREALRIGFIHRITPAGHLLSEALSLAEKINQHPPEAVRSFLALARNSASLSPADLIKWETDRFADLWMSPPFREVLKRYREG